MRYISSVPTKDQLWEKFECNVFSHERQQFETMAGPKPGDARFVAEEGRFYWLDDNNEWHKPEEIWNDKSKP